LDFQLLNTLPQIMAVMSHSGRLKVRAVPLRSDSH